MKSGYSIALVGNPNSGKSSLFNALTGLNQKVGNFPGVTVDKKTGISKISDSLTANIIDLPGTYSIYPKSADEQVTYEVLIDQENPNYPDLIVVVADAANLKRNLLFCSQIIDLGVPVIIALSMNDIARKKGITIDANELERMMGVPVVLINPRKGKGISQLKKAIDTCKRSEDILDPGGFIDVNEIISGSWKEELKQICAIDNDYVAVHVACNYLELTHLNAAQKIQIGAVLDIGDFHKGKVQAQEVMKRYQKIDTIMKQSVIVENPMKRAMFSERVDKLLLHPDCQHGGQKRREYLWD